MSGLFIDIGNSYVPNITSYGCDYYYNLKDYHYLFYVLNNIIYDKYVIHFDGLYMDILEEMVAKGKNTNKYEVRIHNVDEGQYNLFWNYVNKHWTDQTDWFKQ